MLDRHRGKRPKIVTHNVNVDAAEKEEEGKFLSWTSFVNFVIVAEAEKDGGRKNRKGSSAKLFQANVQGWS